METIDNKITINNNLYIFIKSLLNLSEFTLYTINGHHITIDKNTFDYKVVIPIGCFSNKNIKYIPKKIYLNKYSIEKDINFPYTLRENQEHVISLYNKRVKELKNKNIYPYINLSLDCAFGKTVIGVKIISIYKLKTIIIVPRKTLIQQWYEHLKNSNLNVICSYYGANDLIKHKNFNDIDVIICPDKHLSNKDFVDKIYNNFSFIIIDESHYYNMQNPISITKFLAFFPFRMCLGLSGSTRMENCLYLGDDIKFKEKDFIVINDYTSIIEIEKNADKITLKPKENSYFTYNIKLMDKSINVMFFDEINCSLNINIKYNENIKVLKKRCKIDNHILYLMLLFDKDYDYENIQVTKEKQRLYKELYIVKDKNFDNTDILGDTLDHKYVNREMYDIYKSLTSLMRNKKKNKETYFRMNSYINKLIIKDERRYEVILNLIQHIYKDGIRCLILTDFRDTMHKLYNDLSLNFQNVFKGDVQNKIIDAYEKVKTLKNEPYILISTVSASFQGVNIENLNTLIIVNPMSNDKKIVQSCGRILRLNPVQTRSIYIFEDCCINEDIRSYIRDKNKEFIKICKINKWEIKTCIL